MNGNTKQRRWARLSIALVTAAVATGVVSETAGAAPVTVTGGSIVWGVKESFRNYVTGPIAHGTIVVGTPATGAAGIYTFPVSGGSRDSAASTAAAQSTGSVHFAGHDGILEVDLANVEINVTGTTGTIVADMQYRPFTDTTTLNPLQSVPDVAIATLNLVSVSPTAGTNSETFSNVPAVLTTAGAAAFGGFYPAGTALDPVTFTLNSSTTPPVTPPATVTSGGLRWVVSEQIWGQTSLNQCRAAVGTASVVSGQWNDAGSGAVFPTLSGTYDSATGAGSLNLDGGLILGNYAQGNYRLRLTDLKVTVGADGAGALTADVETSLGAGAPPANCNDTRTWSAPANDVTIVVFNADPAQRNTVGGTVYWTVTPPWAAATPQYSFAQGFIDALPASLQGHFRATGGPPVDPSTASNLRKPSAPLYLQFGLSVPNPSATINISATLVDQGALTIAVANTTVVLSNLTLAPSGQRYEAAGQLSQVTVTDTRLTNPGWSVSAQVTDFSGPSGTFAGTGLGWTPAVVSASDGQIVAPGVAVAPGAGLNGTTLASSAVGVGRGTAIVGAALRLQAPTTINPGTYTATLTVTAI